MKRLYGIIFSCLLIICLGGALLFNAVQPVSSLSNSDTLNKVSANAGSTLESDDYDGYWIDDTRLEGVVYADVDAYFNNTGDFVGYGNAGGKGTKADPYKINDALDLAFVSKVVRLRSGSSTFQNRYFEITENIDLAGKYFTPIGGEYLRFENADGSYSYGYRNFYGNIDGNNKTISNMYINNLNACGGVVADSPAGTLTAGQQVGLEYRGANLGFIGYGYRCTISDLKFVNCTVKLNAVGNYVGTAVGILNESVATNITVENCSVTESYTTAENKTNYFGGAIGYVTNSVAEYITAVNTKVAGDYYVGSAIGGVYSGSANYIKINKVGDEIVEDSSSDVSGCYVVGGAIGLVTASASVDDVDVNNVNVIYGSKTNRDAYMGGAFGSVQTNSLAQNIIVNNVKINDTLNTDAGQQKINCGRIGGLTGNINEGVVKNVVVNENCVIIGTDEIGGAAGVVERGELTNLVNYAPIGKRSNDEVVRVDYVGGIAAYLYSSSTTKVTFVTDCHNYGEIYGKSYVGGLIGYTNSISDSGQRIEVYNCSNEAVIDVTGSYIGGIVGYANAGLYLHDTYNAGDIECVDASAYIGGIAGYFYITTYNADTKIEDCFNSGDINDAGSSTAGIIGRLHANYTNAIYYSSRVYITINRVYNSGTISGYSTKNYNGSSNTNRVYYSDIVNLQINRPSNNNEYYNKILFSIQNVYGTASNLFDITDVNQPNAASTTNYNNYNNAVKNTNLWTNIKNYATVDADGNVVTRNGESVSPVQNDFSYFAGDMEVINGKTTEKGSTSWIMDSEAFEGKRPYLRNVDARYLTVVDRNSEIKYVYTVFRDNDVNVNSADYNEIVENLTVLGYTFKGLTEDKTTTDYISGGYTETMSDDITLYAIYTEDAIKVYKVNFEGFDASADADKLKTIIGSNAPIINTNKSMLIYVVKDGDNYKLVGIEVDGNETGKTQTDAVYSQADYLDVTLAGLFSNARWSMKNINGGYSSIEELTTSTYNNSSYSDFTHFNLSSKASNGFIDYVMKNSSMFVLNSDDETQNMGVITLKCDHSTIASIYISYVNDGKIFVGSVEDSLEENYNYYTFETDLANGGSQTLYLNIILNKFYEKAEISLKDVKGNNIAYSVNANGNYVFNLTSGVYSYNLSVNFVKEVYDFGFDFVDTIAVGNNTRYDLSDKVLVNNNVGSTFVVGDVIKVETVLAQTGDGASFVFDSFRLFNQTNNAYSSADVVYTTDGENAYFEFTVTENFLTTYLNVGNGKLVVKAVYVPQYVLTVEVEKTKENPSINAEITIYVGSDANNLVEVSLTDLNAGILYDVNTRVKIVVTPNETTSLVGYEEIAPGEMFEGYVQFDIVSARNVVITLDNTSYAIAFGAITQNGATINDYKNIMSMRDSGGNLLTRLDANSEGQIAEILIDNSMLDETEYKFIGYAIKGYFYVNSRNQVVEVVYRKETASTPEEGEEVTYTYEYKHYQQTDLFVKRHQDAITAYLSDGYEFYGYYDVNTGEYYTYDEETGNYTSDTLDSDGEAKILTYRKVIVSLPEAPNSDNSSYDIAGWLKNINTNSEFVRKFVSDEATDKIYIYAQFMQQYEVSISVGEQFTESGTFKVYIDGMLYTDASGKSSFLNLDLVVPTGSSLKIVADSTVGYQFDRFINCRTISDEANSTTITVVRDYPMINLYYAPKMQMSTVVPEISSKADYSVTSTSGVMENEVSYAIGDVLVFRLSSKPLYEVSDVILNGMTAEEITQKYNATFDGNTLTVVVDQNWVKDMVSSNKFDLKVQTKLQSTVLYIIIAISVVAVAVMAFIIMSIISNNKLKAKVTAEMQQEFRQEMRFNASGVIAGLRAGNDDVGRLTDAEIKAEMKRRKKEGK